MFATHDNLPAQCPNCDAVVHGPYCSQCGQETVISSPTIADLSHEYLNHYVILEKRLWRSLWLLLVRPGQLTIEFLQGRRRRYVRPMPLYVSLSFLFFLLMSIFPRHASDGLVDFSPRLGKETPAVITQTPTAGQLPSAPLATTPSSNAPAPAAHDWLSDSASRIEQAFQRASQKPLQARTQVESVFVSKFPYLMFALMPFFALGSMLLYRKRQRRFGEHLLFALHLHAFVFLSLLLTYWLPIDGLTGWRVLVWWAYLGLGLRTVFGGRYWPQMARAALLVMAHGLIVSIAMGLLLVWAVVAWQ